MHRVAGAPVLYSHSVVGIYVRIDWIPDTVDERNNCRRKPQGDAKRQRRNGEKVRGPSK